MLLVSGVAQSALVSAKMKRGAHRLVKTAAAAALGVGGIAARRSSRPRGGGVGSAAAASA